jgi:transposase
MRGRRPRALPIAPADHAILEWVARGERLPRYQARRARIILGVARGEHLTQLAAQLGCHQSTIWRVCRRYERGGLSGLLSDGRKKYEPEA